MIPYIGFSVYGTKDLFFISSSDLKVGYTTVPKIYFSEVLAISKWATLSVCHTNHTERKVSRAAYHYGVATGLCAGV